MNPETKETGSYHELFMTPEFPQGGFGLRCLWAAGVFVSYDEPICVKSSVARHPAELQVRWFSGTGPSFLPQRATSLSSRGAPPPTPNPSPHPSPTPRPRPLKDPKLKHLTGPVSECDPQPGARNALCTHRHTHTQWPSWDALGFSSGIPPLDLTEVISCCACITQILSYRSSGVGREKMGMHPYMLSCSELR